MSNEFTDIVIPVWNRPVETRACLASLVEHTANARLILVDNSSDRETERMLEEFAEALDVRVLFLKNRVNEGFVKAVNRGLSLAESRFVAIVRQSSIVGPAWFEPLLDFMMQTPDAGIVVPTVRGDARSTGKRPVYRGMEISSADFSALLLRRSLLDTVGSFNEEMDGGDWCLREYSRSLWKWGYRTCIVPEGSVDKGEELALGSPVRRAEQERMIRAGFVESWGEERAFCIHLPKESDLVDLPARSSLIATAARQGHRITIVSHPSAASALVRHGMDRIHENITIAALSRMMVQRSARKAVADVSERHPQVTHVCWGEGGCFIEVPNPIPFADLETFVLDNERRFYGRETTL